MKKKLVALFCIAAMVMVPSMGVMAAEPGEAPGDIKEPVVTSESQVAGTQVTTNQPTGTDKASDTLTTPGTSTGTAEIQGTQNDNAGLSTSTNAPTDSQNPSNGNDAGTTDLQEPAEANGTTETTDVTEKPVLAVQSKAAAAPQTMAANNGVNIRNSELSKGAAILIGEEDKILEDGIPYTPTGATGKVTWHEDTNTLELDNFILEVAGQDDIFIAMIGDATIILTGDNCLVAKEGTIEIWGYNDLTIKGGGSLTTEASTSGLGTGLGTLGGSINIEGVNITLNSSEDTGMAGILLSDESSIESGTPSQSSINITDSIISGERMQIFSYGGINFNGKSKVTASSAGEAPAIVAIGKIVFNLSTDGWVKATASTSPDSATEAIVSFSGIDFQNGNRITNLLGGKVAYNSEGEYWFIADSEGNPAGYVVVEGPEKAKVAASETTKVVKNGATAGVKTGDYAQTGLWLAIMLAAVGCVAVTIKKRRA